MSLEKKFDPVFATTLAFREKQIQQNYRPLIGIHKWFARRPGTVFRNLLLAEFNSAGPLKSSYWRSHSFQGVIADPFMGGGTPIIEANRLGFSVIGADINPMAFWVVRQALVHLDIADFASKAETIISDVERTLFELYRTECIKCGKSAVVKYFIWVKTQACPHCETVNDLFPGYLLAEAVRHPKHVIICGHCGVLNEYLKLPTRKNPKDCRDCGRQVHIEGPARRQKITCRKCESVYSYPQPRFGSPVHRMWALEYHCDNCKPQHVGRFFKSPDLQDLNRFRRAQSILSETSSLPIPKDKIPDGDETARLHRWGYRHYQEMFNERQLLGLGLLLQRIRELSQGETYLALLTVFSDFLRYQNMLCRYDTYALKCQDIFSVHGFPIGLVQCENNLLGIPKIGSGAFRHFIAKYIRAKNYCVLPFETQITGTRKRLVPIPGERIKARITKKFPSTDKREAALFALPANEVVLPRMSLDGVFTDPPYFDNVQYAELIDFCFSWLRIALKDEFREFMKTTTRMPQELTGNVTLGRGLEHFTAGLSAVFIHYARALKPRAPFVFTYHHNSPSVYMPIVVAVLDAGMLCTATLPAAAEMNASLHIAGTSSSVLDSVFVCRKERPRRFHENAAVQLSRDALLMKKAGVRLTEGDLRCLLAGHVARIAINKLWPSWNKRSSLTKRMERASRCLDHLTENLRFDSLVSKVFKATSKKSA